MGRAESCAARRRNRNRNRHPPFQNRGRRHSMERARLRRRVRPAARIREHARWHNGCCAGKPRHGGSPHRRHDAPPVRARLSGGRAGRDSLLPRFRISIQRRQTPSFMPTRHSTRPRQRGAAHRYSASPLPTPPHPKSSYSWPYPNPRPSHGDAAPCSCGHLTAPVPTAGLRAGTA